MTDLHPYPKPTKREKKPRKLLRSRTHIKPRNAARAARMHERNYLARPAVEPFCLVDRLLVAYQARRGMKMQPRDWQPCATKIDAAHATRDRGMGGVNSSAADVVYLCRTHHDELGRMGRPAFEAKYGCDLAGEAARVAAGDVEPLPPE